MNTINQIREKIVNESKFRESHLSKIENESLLERISDKAGLDTKEKYDVAKFILVITNELRERSESVAKNSTNRLRFSDSQNKYDYASVDNSKFGQTSVFSRFLNSYDKEGSEFIPLLNRLKSNSGEELSTIIFDEIQKVHKNWENVYRNADQYLNLQLNHVTSDEIQSLKDLTSCGLFTRLTNDRFGFMSDIHNPICFKEQRVFQHDSDYNKSDIAKTIIANHSYSLDFHFKIRGSLFLISNDDRYFITGTDENRKFVFRRLNGEYQINDYTFDFSDTESDSVKAETLRTMIEMSLSEISLKRKTSMMTPQEAVVFSINYLVEANGHYNGDYREEPTLENNRQILESLGSIDTNEHNKIMSFTDESKAYITGFVKSLRKTDFHELNLKEVSKYMNLHAGKDFEYLSHDALDLINSHTERWKHSETVNTVSLLVNHYQTDLSTMEELLKIAKSLDAKGLSLLEVKLNHQTIDIEQFEKDLKTRNKPANNFPF